jgi:hypothetical protein
MHVAVNNVIHLHLFVHKIVNVTGNIKLNVT